MAWGPPGETVYKKTLMSRFEVPLNKIFSVTPGFIDFTALMQEGDEIYLEEEKNNHRGYRRLVGRRPSGLTYCLVLSSFMS